MCLNPQQERHERVAIAPTSLPANRSFAGAAAQQRAWQVRSERPLLDWELRMKLRPERSCRTQPRTDGSNPSLSSRESTNFRFLSIPPAVDRGGLVLPLPMSVEGSVPRSA